MTSCRARGPAGGVVRELLLALPVALGAILLLVLWPFGLEPRHATNLGASSTSDPTPPVAVVSPDASLPLVRAPADQPAGPPPAQAPATISTFLEGVPALTLLVDVTEPPPAPFDWSRVAVRHTVPKEGDAFGILKQGCVVVVLSRSAMPAQGDLRIDLERCPILDVRLTNVPPRLRDNLVLQLQVEYDTLDSEAHNSASSQMPDRRPIEMQEDGVLVPLSVRKSGRLVVHAKSRSSNISYPSPKRAFAPISQVIEIDLSELEAACSLASLHLTLRFPYPYPSGDLDLSLVDAAGRSITYKRLRRNGEFEHTAHFVDLPRAKITPELRLSRGARPRICLAPIDLIDGDVHVGRDVVAEGSLAVTVSGRDGLPADGVSVLLSDDLGNTIAANWPRETSFVFQHLPAMVAHVQAVAYDAHRCSPIIRVPIGAAEAHAVILDLVPAGEVSIEQGAFGAGVQFLDVAYSPSEVSRVFLKAKGVTRKWLPVGRPSVRWHGRVATMPVVEGVMEDWSLQ